MNEVYSNNQNKALQYLDRVQSLAGRIEKRALEIAALRLRASGAGAIRYDKDRVQTSPDDRMALFMDDLIRKDKEQKEDIDSLYDIKAETYSIIRTLEDDYERIYLENVYINDMTMADTANAMNMSERNLYNIRLNALENFGETL